MDDVLASGRARSVVGVLDNSDAVETLMPKLAELGIGAENVTVMTRDASGSHGPLDPRSSIISGGAATGAAFGGLLGGLAGWMISIGALAIPGVLVPGVGLVFGAGTLASLVAGIAVGAAAGGLIGALLGIGVPEEEAKQYEQSLTSGRTIVTAHIAQNTDDQAVKTAFEESGAYDVRVYETPARRPVENTRTVRSRRAGEETAAGATPRHDEVGMGIIEDPVPTADASAPVAGPEIADESGAPASEPGGVQRTLQSAGLEEPTIEDRTKQSGRDVTTEDERSPGV